MVESQLKITTLIVYLVVMMLALRWWYLNMSWKEFYNSYLKLSLVSDFVTLQSHLDKLINAFESGDLTSIKSDELASTTTYSEIIRYLISNFRRFGVSLKDPLILIRSKLIDEIEHEEKLYSDYLRGLFQFVTISAFSWIFFFFAQNTVVVANKESVAPLIILLFQVAGFCLHHLTFVLQKDAIFSPLNQIMQPLTLCATLSGIGIEKNSILELFVPYQKEDFRKVTKVYNLASRFEKTVYGWGEVGGQSELIFQELVTEAFSVKKLLFKSFIIRMGRLRFLILIIFFLGSYFWQLFSFLSLFLIE